MAASPSFRHLLWRHPCRPHHAATYSAPARGNLHIPRQKRALSQQTQRVTSSSPRAAGAGVGVGNSRIQRLQSRLPAFLRSYTTPLLNAPISHITSFLLLHELTAVIPLFGLAGFFHYTNWLPPFFSEGKWISDGVEKFGRWFKRRGWLGKDVVVTEGGREKERVKREEDVERRIGRREKWWGRGEGGLRLVVEFATAYAVTKALMPLRIIFSVWATPWFARNAVIPGLHVFRRIFWRRKGKDAAAATPSPGAGTGAIGGSTVAKDVRQTGSTGK